jgi:hypothetical protein
MQLSKAGGFLTKLGSNQSDPSGIAVDAAHVYFTTLNGGSVAKVPIGGASAPITLSFGQSNPSGIAVDATHVYWASAGNASVRKTPK